MIQTKALVNFLKGAHSNLSFLNRLKLHYRPYICPFDQLLEYINEGDIVFDIGCGQGQFCMLAANFKHAKYIYGVEISDELIATARSNFEKQNFINYFFRSYDGIQLPDSITKADIVFMIDVLHHIPKARQEPFLKHLYTMMKPGARLILKDIDASSMFVYCNKLHDLILSKEIGNELRWMDAEKLCRNIGFHLMDTKKQLMFWYPHYTLVFRK